MHNAISVEHLAYQYPGVDDTPGIPVFEDLNLTIEKGSFVAILGGCIATKLISINQERESCKNKLSENNCLDLPKRSVGVENRAWLPEEKEKANENAPSALPKG